MKINIEKELFTLKNEILDAVPDIIAETAVEYFQDTFRKKAFDGAPWPNFSPGYKHRTNGSLLIDSAALLNSVRPSLISRDLVTISAGNEKVPYARAHNESFVGSVVVPAHKRTSKKGKEYSVKQHSMNMRLPQRQFLGDAKELQQQLHYRIEGFINSLNK